MVSEEKSKVYQRKRNWLTLYGLLLNLALLLGAIGLGFTFHFYEWASRINSSPYGIVLFYFLFFTLYSILFSFPLSFYSGFILEHQYELSNQTFLAWFWEWKKKTASVFRDFRTACFDSLRVYLAF